MDHVDILLLCKQTGKMVPALVQEKLDELATANPKLYGRLVEHGLAEPLENENGVPTLGPMLDRFFAERGNTVGDNTLKNWGHTKRNLLQKFGKDTELNSITKGDSKAFENFLIQDEKLGEKTTTRRRIGNCKMFFEFAKDYRWIDENPFSDLKSSVEGNSDKFHFVDRNTVELVLRACPDLESQIIFALARFGGLRCPSEIIKLKWSDVDFEKRRITVTAPKTKRYVGKETRIIPLYPELEPYLTRATDQSGGGEYVVKASRDKNVNFRTRFEKILKAAGVEQWPKLFQNLRSTRQTELIDEGHPAHVVAKWMGNSEVVAKDHYYQVTDDHFTKAVETVSRKDQSQEESDSGSKKNPREDGNDRQPGECERKLVGVTEVESVTSCMSSKRSNQLSYTPALPDLVSGFHRVFKDATALKSLLFAPFRQVADSVNLLFVKLSVFLYSV